MNPMNLSFILNEQANPQPQAYSLSTPINHVGALTLNVQVILSNIPASPNPLSHPQNQVLSPPKFTNIYQTPNDTTLNINTRTLSNNNNIVDVDVEIPAQSASDEPRSKELPTSNEKERERKTRRHYSVHSRQSKKDSKEPNKSEDHKIHPVHPPLIAVSHHPTIRPTTIVDQTQMTIAKHREFQSYGTSQNMSNSKIATQSTLNFIDETVSTIKKTQKNKRKLESLGVSKPQIKFKKPRLISEIANETGTLDKTILEKIHTVADFILCKSCEAKKDQVAPLCKSCTYRLNKESASPELKVQKEAAKILLTLQ